MSQADEKQCACPMKPFAQPGSMAAGSATEMTAIRKWRLMHGNHPYARAREELATALQDAEQAVGLEAVERMVREILDGA